MKKIDAITRCKGIISDVLKRKSNRILRQVDQAIDAAKDSAQDAREAAEEIMNKFGEYAESTQTTQLKDRLVAYKNKIVEAQEFDEVAKIFENLKKELNKEVEVEETA